LQLAGASNDGARWILATNIYADETLAAVVTAEGGWLDLERRKLRLPPEKLHRLLMQVPRAEDFQELKNLIRQEGE
jgi:acyl-CoA thioester hydrolase